MARSPARCNSQGRRVAHFWRRYLHKVADEMIEAEKLIGAGFTHEAHAITRRDGEALLGSMTGGTGASIHDGSSLRGYPETLSSCHSDITQHSCGSETQGDRKEKAY